MGETPKSILIIKLSAIGDVVHTLPFLEVLRDNFPEARVDWVVEEESSQIIDAHEGIDNVIISRRKSWRKRLLKGREGFAALREIIRFLKELRSNKYDLVIDLQGLFKSAILTGLSRGKSKIGPNWGREGSQLFLTERPFFVEADKHAVDKYLKVAEYLGCEKDSWKGHIPIRESDKSSIDKVLDDKGVKDQKLVAINPFAKWTTKLWQPERFAALADRMQRELGCGIIFTGSGQDRAEIDEIMERMHEKSTNLAGDTTLKELAYLYSKCQLLVTTDTGPMHIAAAMDCPVVALFGPTAPWRTGPYGKGHTVIRDEIECSPCFNKKCDHVSCMRNITVDKVFEKVKEQINVLRV
ncbi:MAG: lipopolysaccharide heptosyltransferase I [Desulfobacteraceae bacterium]|jgi:3-deoxy-D-manno-octulosonic-acid transferase/heptosyltransferase-1